MPIKTLQHRLTEIGRLRLGHKVATKGGRTRPARLAQWRLTSPHEELLLHAAGVYGGEVQPWTDAPSEHPQWELYSDSDTLHVLIPPGQALSQWYELWSGGGCRRRCDGETEMTGDPQPCVCATETTRPEDYPCKPTTRLNVVLADVPAVGLWRCEIHGYYGAVELAGMAQLLEDMGVAGRVLPATLRIEQRSIKRPGQPGKQFVVPVLAPEHSFMLQLARSSERMPGELEASPASPAQVEGAAASPAGPTATPPVGPAAPTPEADRGGSASGPTSGAADLGGDAAPDASATSPATPWMRAVLAERGLSTAAAVQVLATTAPDKFGPLRPGDLLDLEGADLVLAAEILRADAGDEGDAGGDAS